MISVQVSVDPSALEATVKKFTGTLTDVHMLDAVRKGAAVVKAVYAQVLYAQRVKAGAGTGNPSFAHAYKSISVKVGRFSDGTGAWAVIGPSVVGGRLLAPQQQFGEHGTEIRKTKTDQNRGIMPAFNWLATANAASMDAAKQAILKRLMELGR